MRRYEDVREPPVPGTREAAVVARDAPVEDPRAIEETSAIESQRATREEREKDPTAAKDIRGETLSDEDLRLIEQLKQRDAEVRAHEQAHIAAGGAYIISGPSYSYQTGPDGKRYAIGGEVGIDTSMNSGDPERNLEKARAIIRAAMAPAEPSAQDLRVAALARAMEIRAQQELLELQIKESKAAMAASRPVRGSTPPGKTEAVIPPTASAEHSNSAERPSQGSTGGQERLAQRIAALFSTASVEAGVSRLA
ncbi:MAG: putative metalloprotease CJM1_0395 family protein [Thermochromatium sp.]